MNIIQSVPLVRCDFEPFLKFLRIIPRIPSSGRVVGAAVVTIAGVTTAMAAALAVAAVAAAATFLLSNPIDRAAFRDATSQSLRGPCGTTLWPWLSFLTSSPNN
jgi:hypothetical protein